MHTDQNSIKPRAVQDEARIVLSGYEFLRFGGGRWGQVLAKLVRPAFRLHRYRNTSTRMWREAICANDARLRDKTGRNRLEPGRDIRAAS